jgi:hypothetical protein
MIFEKIDDSNFLLFAAQNYDNPQCTEDTEFFDDLKKFKYLKRLFNKYQESGELKERLVLNHLIVIYNLFGSAATRMLFFRLNEYLSILKPFLILLNRLPDKVEGIGSIDNDVITSDIESDQHVVDVLRSI